MNRRNWNKSKVTEILYYAAGAGFFMIFAKEKAPVWLCIGAACLALGASHKKSRK